MFTSKKSDTKDIFKTIYIIRINILYSFCVADDRNHQGLTTRCIKDKVED